MDEKSMQLGTDYAGQDVTGWIATEKFNGCRGYWDGQTMWTRGGIAVKLPQSWLDVLPAGVALDGEVYDGIDGVYRCGSAVKYGKFTDSMSFVVFDCPSVKSGYMDRICAAGQFVQGPLQVVRPFVISGLDEALDLLHAVTSKGGEGLMLRPDDDSIYRKGRTEQLLKLKEGMV